MCWHWECPSCPPSPLLNPRRSTVWRTPWRLWKTTTKSPSASTPPLRRTCRRTWCLRNTICSGFRNSWPWLRRYDIITVVHTHRGQSPRESVLCLFLLCRVVSCVFRSWRRSSRRLLPIATWRKSWPRRTIRSKTWGNNCRGEDGVMKILYSGPDQKLNKTQHLLCLAFVSDTSPVNEFSKELKTKQRNKQ